MGNVIGLWSSTWMLSWKWEWVKKNMWRFGWFDESSCCDAPQTQKCFFFLHFFFRIDSVCFLITNYLSEGNLCIFNLITLIYDIWHFHILTEFPPRRSISLFPSLSPFNGEERESFEIENRRLFFFSSESIHLPIDWMHKSDSNVHACMADNHTGNKKITTKHFPFASEWDKKKTPRLINQFWVHQSLYRIGSWFYCMWNFTMVPVHFICFLFSSFVYPSYSFFTLCVK